MALASRLLELRVDHLMSWGLAGALVAHLKPGAVILPTTLVGSDHRRHTVHAGWWEDTLESLGKSGPVSRESLAESRSALVYRAHKQALHAATNAVAVDMESVGVARVAEAAGVPFLCVRVIVDSLDHDIPAWISDHLDRSGGVKPAVLIRRAVRAPRDWGALLVLSLALARALNRLHRVAPLILGNGHPTRPPNIPSKRYP
jgi:nucleoside phosphorylase